jgi:hypothetical protein
MERKMTGSQIEWWLAVSPIIAIFIAMLAWPFWSILEMRSHVSRAGRMKRGVRIWAEPLPADIKRFLQRIPDDGIYGSAGAFLKKRDNTVLVQPHPMKTWWGIRVRVGKGGSLPYVAYIDLRTKEPKIQYRVPISSFLFFVLWMTMAVYLSLQEIWGVTFVVGGGLLLFVQHFRQRRVILGFIKKQMQVYHT